MPSHTPAIHTFRKGFRHILLNGSAEPADIIRAIQSPDETLHSTSKRSVVRAGRYVLKSRRIRAGKGVVAMTIRRKWYRQPWRTALRMVERDIPVATPRALVEAGAVGIIWNITYVSDYLSNAHDIVAYLQRVIGTECSEAERTEYFTSIAMSVRAIESAGIRAHDLKYTNILTQDGRKFVLVDLDDTELDVPHTDSSRFTIYSQLYRAFRPLYESDAMAPLIQPLITNDEPLQSYMARLERAYTEWRRQVPASHPYYGNPKGDTSPTDS